MNEKIAVNLREVRVSDECADAGRVVVPRPGSVRRGGEDLTGQPDLVVVELRQWVGDGRLPGRAGRLGNVVYMTTKFPSEYLYAVPEQPEVALEPLPEGSGEVCYACSVPAQKRCRQTGRPTCEAHEVDEYGLTQSYYDAGNGERGDAYFSSSSDED